MAKQPNYWLICGLALLLNIGVTFVLILGSADSFIPKTEEKVVEEIIIGSPEHFNFVTQGIDDLIADLKAKKEELAMREKRILELEERVNAEKDELIHLKKEIVEYREELTQSVLTLESSEEKNLKSLAVTYTNLSPEAAVAIFSEMDDVFVVKILSYMPTDAVAPIFQTMSAKIGKDGKMSERVARFSEMIRLTLNEKKK